MRTQSTALVACRVLVVGVALTACSAPPNDGPSGASAGSMNGGAGAPASGGAASAGASGAPEAGSSGSAAQAGSAGMPAGGAGTSGMGGAGNPPATPRVVMYLDNYTDPSWSGWATKVDFAKMTHLNLAFALSSSKNDWDFGESDADVQAIVDKAHAAGVKVLASLGGAGGDKTVYTQYNTDLNQAAMVANLDAFLKRFNLDGADMDIEDGSNLGAGYNAFVNKVSAVLKPEGKLVTAAVAGYLKDSYSNDTLQAYDFVNVMTYANNLDRYNADAAWLVEAGVAKANIVFGTGFHGADTDDNHEISYSQLLKTDSMAWNKLEFQIGGITYYLADVDMTKQIATLSKGYGGIMAWTYTEDVTGEYSLWKAIQDTM